MKTRTAGLSFAIATLLGASGPLYAQTAPSPSPSALLDEVVVTANKREEKLHDVAMSITAVGGDDLLHRQETGFNDFAAQVPGLSIEAVDAGRDRIVLRGQNVGSVGATIATTVDDIPFFMSGAQANGSFFSSDVDTFDLKRVEVLRGPQGTLYGAAAEGGLIKYVTNAPDPTRLEGAVYLGGETVDGGGTAGTAKGLINVPFWDGKAALRVSAVEEGLPGWIDNETTGQKDVNHGEKYSLRGSLLITPVDALTIRVTAFNQGLKVHGDNSVEVVGAAAAPSAPPANQYDLFNGYQHGSFVEHTIDNQLEYYALNVEYGFNAATLLSATSYGRIDHVFVDDVSDANLIPGVTYSEYLGGAVYGQPIIVAGNQHEFVHKFNQELRLTSKPGSTLFGHAFDWQGGAFFTRETTLLAQPFNAFSETATTVPLAPPLGGDNVAADYKETAFFADVTYHFSSAFDVELGGRSTLTQQNQQTSFTCCVLFGPADTTFPGLYSSQTSRTWSGAPRWHINDDVLVYARVATGFRPGGPNLPTPTLPTPPAFKADSTRNYELGIRADVFDKAVTIDLAAYDIEWKDIQILEIVATPNGPNGINGNAGNARSSGVEWNFAWRPVSALTIQLLGAYTNAKLTVDAAGLNANSGDKLPYVPDVSSTLNVDYKWNAFANVTGFAGATWAYTGTRYSGFSPSAPIESHAKLPTYNALNLRLGLEGVHYSAEVFANNMTNSKGITEYENESGPNQTGLATFIQPRTIGIQLGAKF